MDYTRFIACNCTSVFHDTVEDPSLLHLIIILHSVCQWKCGLRRGSAVARLLGFWVRIQPAAWMSVFRECRVLSSRGICVGLNTRPEKSYRVCLSVTVKPR